MQDWFGIVSATVWLWNGILSISQAVKSNGKPREGAYSDMIDGVPDEAPSIVAIKRAIPRQCFQANVWRSLYYVVKDIALVAGSYGVLRLLEWQPYMSLRYVFTPVYVLFQGTLFWAVFVLGHDCGHGSFSGSGLLNDTLGTLLHTFLLVPYYPWKLSHRHHHKNTGNFDKDEIFYPVRQKYAETNFKPLTPVFGFGSSWFMYLFVGYYPRNICHFNVFERIFHGYVLGCVTSIVSLTAWSFLLFHYWQLYGLSALICHYGAPLFVFASWLVLVTFLHHNDTGVPWYSDSTWDNVRGQLSSVDRHYGWAHDLTHNIGTHQIHHLFTKIPHYHLEEAANAFRKSFPNLVRMSREPIMPAAFRIFNVFVKQRTVPDSSDVHIYRD